MGAVDLSSGPVSPMDRPRLVRWSSSVESSKDYYTRKEWIQKNRSFKRRKKSASRSKSERALLAKKWLAKKTTKALTELCQESDAFKNVLTAALASMPVLQRDAVWCSIEHGLCKMEMREFNHCRLQAVRMHPNDELPPSIAVFSALFGLLWAVSELRAELVVYATKEDRFPVPSKSPASEQPHWSSIVPNFVNGLIKENGTKKNGI